jgi:ComF family protein
MIGKALLKLVDTVYPPSCIACKAETSTVSGLCGTCWAETGFIGGLTCRSCGIPLAGDAADDAYCDSCLQAPPAFQNGRAALLYEGCGRKLVLALKHGDRQDTAKPMAQWMAKAGKDLLDKCDLIAPVPLHWRRLLKRRYNQSSELARHLAKLSGRPFVPDLIIRHRATPSQDGLDRAARFANQVAAFKINPRYTAMTKGKRIVLVDDVMTTGATLSSCADTCLGAGAQQVDVMVLARVAKDR